MPCGCNWIKFCVGANVLFSECYADLNSVFFNFVKLQSAMLLR